MTAPFLPEEVKNLLRAVIDMTLTTDLSKLPQSPLAAEAMRQLHADMRSKDPPTPEEVRMRTVRIQVANLLTLVVSGHKIPNTEDSGTASKLLTLFAARLR